MPLYCANNASDGTVRTLMYRGTHAHTNTQQHTQQSSEDIGENRWVGSRQLVVVRRIAE